MTDLHLDVFGTGVPAVFVHGSFGWGLDTFPEQRALADEYRVVLIDRRGFGASPPLDGPTGWATDMHDVAEVLAEVGPAHLVGQSYGAVVALLASGLRPEGVRSLIVIEPPAFDHAPDDEDAAFIASSLRPVFDRAHGLSPEEFARQWFAGLGFSPDEIDTRLAGFGEADWAAVDATRRERWPGDAPFDFDALASAPFSKVVVRGAWPQDLAPTRQRTARAFGAVCERIATLIGARVVVFERSAHNPQLEQPEEFNSLLREVWAAAE